jgi:20S proteasome alpha/beta subunit
VLKNVMEEKITKHNVEVCMVRTDTKRFTSMPVEEIEKILPTLTSDL